jgi:hypothetical protein
LLPELPTFYIERKFSKEEAEEYVGETVPDKEATLTEYGIYRDSETDEAVVVYAPFVGNIDKYRQAILNTPMTTTPRAQTGFRNISRTFGNSPRAAFKRRESCRATSLAADLPELHQELVNVTDNMVEMLKKYVPEQFEQDIIEMEQVEQDWRISKNSLWTSGVINKASALPYHRDRNNFETWSAMPVIRRGMRGGMLHMYGYDQTVECRDGSVTMFNGYRYVHGVTPMKPVVKDAYRYSVVYYALRGMKDCHTTALEEREYAQKKRTEREQEMVANFGTDPTKRNLKV